MTCWWWVRHGPTHAKGMVGWTDLPADLSDDATLLRLNAHLPDQALVVSSDLSRAVATADRLAAPGRDRLPHTPAIRELNFGTWEGREFTEIAKSDPEISRAYWSDPGDTAAPGGESWNETAGRVADFVADINASHPGRDIIAVAHFGVILTQVQAAGRLSARSALAFKIDNLSVTRLEFLDPGWRIHGVNQVP